MLRLARTAAREAPLALLPARLAIGALLAIAKALLHVRADEVRAHFVEDLRCGGLLAAQPRERRGGQRAKAEVVGESRGSSRGRRSDVVCHLLLRVLQRCRVLQKPLQRDLLLLELHALGSAPRELDFRRCGDPRFDEHAARLALALRRHLLTHLIHPRLGPRAVRRVRREAMPQPALCHLGPDPRRVGDQREANRSGSGSSTRGGGEPRPWCN